MNGFVMKARAVLALGLPNVARVASYRIGLKLGFNPVRRLHHAMPEGPFFHAMSLQPLPFPEGTAWRTSMLLFGYWQLPLAFQPPDWLANPFTGQRVPSPERAWWRIPDFDPQTGDIKLVWELSRMDWVVAFAQRLRGGDAAVQEVLNTWLADWCRKNPPYFGPNWKCGQEASIRVMHLALAAMIVGQVRSTSKGLRDLVSAHLRRIAPTLQYAVAQENNHGTSEAAALFIGGSWLVVLGQLEGLHWQRMGRRWLENRAARLIGADGSFSQYSLNYHRLMLDTLSLAEVWRRYLDLPAFSDRFRARAVAATNWLHNLVNPVNGDGPNLGANDGAQLLPIVDSGYRDYRPSVQLAMALFANRLAYEGEGPSTRILGWMGIPLPAEVAPKPGSSVADVGGVAVLRRGNVTAVLRYPRFRFRPSQADALHLDFWLDGNNTLRDAGSYSYNTDTKWLDYFGGAAGHNTLQFDDRDQMPRISRFLFGDWLKTSCIEMLRESATMTQFGAGYRDRQGAAHCRRLKLYDSRLEIEDVVTGFARKAVLRWRVSPGPWILEGQCLRNGQQEISVRASVPIVRCELVEGWESRHYLEKNGVPVLEVEIEQPGSFTTEYCWSI